MCNSNIISKCDIIFFYTLQGYFMNTTEQQQWAKEQLKNIMDGGQKTRYKALSGVPNDLEKVENAFLMVAQSKKQAYTQAYEAVLLESFNSYNGNLDVSNAILELQHYFVDINEISMLPD